MQGVPDFFDDKRDDAQFRHLPELPGVELYRAHIVRHAFEPHTHEAFGIGAIIAGSQRFRYRGEQHQASSGAVIMMNPDELHTGEAQSDLGWQYQMLYLEPALLEKVSGLRTPWFNLAVKMAPQRAEHISRLINQLWYADSPLSQQGILLDLVQTFQPYIQHGKRPTKATAPRFNTVKEYLHDNYMQPITLDELANIIPLSRYHFLRQFKAHYHVTPHQMLMAIRLWRAKQFLSAGIPASDVAPLCGLTDQSHLNRTFSQRYGTTPGRFQKQTARSVR